MKTVNVNKKIANSVQILEKVIIVVAMVTKVAIKFLIIIFLVLSGYEHSVKVSSNYEMGP